MSMKTLPRCSRSLYLLLVFSCLRAADKGADEIDLFKQRVEEYAQLRQRLEKGLPKLKKKTSAARIAAHKQALAAAIRANRADAKPGDIFVPEAQLFLRRIVQSQLHGAKGASARAATHDGNPKIDPKSPPVTLQVNAAYPAKAPRSTVPPVVLLSLPPLPKELEYRFVGRDLVLLDVTANLIVDYMHDAVPQS